jgi:hypothetical protein
MKTSALVRIAAVAAFACSPFVVQAAELEGSVQRCMDVFATQNFADRTTSFKVERERPVLLPLIASTGTRQVQMIATDRASGKVLATAQCEVKSSTKIGEIIIASTAR